MWNERPDGYPILTRNPTGMGTGTKVYQWVHVKDSTRGIYTTRWVFVLPALNPTVAIPNYQNKSSLKKAPQ
jgi:hypothetical protein